MEDVEQLGYFPRKQKKPSGETEFNEGKLARQVYSARRNKLLSPEQVTKLDSYKRHGVHLQDAARFAEPVEATGAAATGADDASPSQEPVLQLQRLRGKLPDMSAAPSSCAEKKEMQTQPQLRGPSIYAKSVKFPWREDVALPGISLSNQLRTSRAREMGHSQGFKRMTCLWY